MSPGRRWIATVVTLLAGNVLAGVMLIAAAHHGASRVLPNYYEEGVHYDDAIDQAGRNRALAWNVGITIVDGVATVTATDAHGQPVEHANVHVSGVERSDSAGPLDGELAMASPGVYRARVGGRGWVDVSITIGRGDDRYSHRLALEAR